MTPARVGVRPETQERRLAVKVLFIGGTGLISTACTDLALRQGVELVHLNRGVQVKRPRAGVRLIKADIRDKAAARKALKKERFDCVVDWIAFTTDHVETDIELFAGRTRQYIFISSASAYQKPQTHYLVTESTPLANPHWEYSRNKIACEERLMREYRDRGFPVTIVRPSYTYGQVIIPTPWSFDYTIVDRMRRGKKIIVHGDGTSLWQMTHNTDFAKGLAGLLGNLHALGHAFHITTDEVLSWDQIHRAIGRAAGVDEPRIVHLPSEFIARYSTGAGESLLGDKALSTVFDNSKIKRFVPGFVATVPFAEGVKESVAWFDADPRRRRVSKEQNDWTDRAIADYERIGRSRP